MTQRPNIILILTDNQAPWTLGCYGNAEIRTPNIDRLAADGARFDNAFCTNPVCSPNRATLMTGLMPSQHGVHNWLGTEKPDAQMGDDAYCTIEEFATLPRMLSQAGYNCGLSGKWHLGDSLNPQLGFRYWFTKPRGHTHTFYDAEAIWQNKVYKEPRYFTDAITEHAIDFLNQAEDDPFFLYVPYNGPYGLDHDMYVGHRNRHADYYADKELNCFPREPVHPWLVKHRDAVANQTAMRSYASAVSGVDDGVGAIMNQLDTTGRAGNTLIIYTADHGLCGGHHGMWGMGDHAKPRHMFQENLRVPLIVRHPETISANKTVDATVNHYDFLPSMASYLGLSNPQLNEHPLPGRDYSPLLQGKPIDDESSVTFHEYEETRAVQTRQWKLILRNPNGPNELYDLINDPQERNNLFDQPEHDTIQASLTGQLETFFARHATAEYDLWANGRSKAGQC